MNSKVQLNLDAAAFMAWMMHPHKSAAEAKKDLSALATALQEVDKVQSEDPQVKNGRPFKCQHPHWSQGRLKEVHHLLFVKENIKDNDYWRNPKSGLKPKGFHQDQEDMEPDSVRLNNGVIAVLTDLQDIPPMPRYE